jgi:hypothetical protein
VFLKFVKNFEKFVFQMKRIIAISLLILFVAGQVNLTWASHYCMSFKVKSSVMLGKGQLDCGMGNMMDCSNDESSCEKTDLEASKCCSNDYITSDSDDYFEKEKSDYSSKLFAAIEFEEAFLSYSPEANLQIVKATLSPPLIQPDRQVMYQSFLL